MPFMVKSSIKVKKQNSYLFYELICGHSFITCYVIYLLIESLNDSSIVCIPVATYLCEIIHGG